MGRDWTLVRTLHRSADFNSHARVGRDSEQVRQLVQVRRDFNSHARVGRDVRGSERMCRRRISTHTPAWGVTALTAQIHTLRQISTHTPAWGVTFFCRVYSFLCFYFNSHARVGRDYSCHL